MVSEFQISCFLTSRDSRASPTPFAHQTQLRPAPASWLASPSRSTCGSSPREIYDVDVDTFVEGLQVEAKPLLSTLLGAGRVKGGAGDGGAIDYLCRPVPGGSAVLHLEPGLWVHALYESETQTLGRVRIPESCSGIGRSEIARDLSALRLGS